MKLQKLILHNRRKKKTFRIIAGLCAIIIVSAACIGCNSIFSGNNESENEAVDETQSDIAADGTIILHIFDKNVNGEAFNDAVAKKIMEETGVKIKIVDATDNATGKAELMLRDKDYPDIVLLEQGDLVNRYIEAGALIPLDDLVEQYGSHIKEMYGDILNKSRYTDGKLYWFANWYGADYDASAGVLMRKDILTKLAGAERAESNEPFTTTEYTELLEKFKKEYPIMDGQDTIALELDADSKNYITTMRAMYGLKTYEEDKEGNLKYLPDTEKYRESMLYLNKLYTEGLLDKEWIINTSDRWEEKLASGCVFSTWSSYWDTQSVNEKLTEKYGEDSQFYCYKVVADDLDASETTYNARNSLGWDAIGITDNCKHVKEAMKVLDYLASEEGQYLLLWGVEGETWNEENGKHVPDSEFLAQWEKDSEKEEQSTGVRRWTWMIKNGNGSDGTPYDLTTKYVPSGIEKFANASFEKSDYWDTAEYSGLEPTVKSDYGLEWQNIEDIYDQNYSKVICASDHEEAEILYDKMLDNMKVAGLDACEKYITQQHKKRMENWK